MSIHSGALLFLISTLSTYFTFQIGSRVTTGTYVRVSPKQLCSRAGIISSLGYGWYWLFYSASFRHSPTAALSAALNYTWPLFTAIFATLLFSGVKLGRPFAEQIILFSGMIIGCGAVALVLLSVDQGNADSIPVLAILFGLGAGAAYGLYSAFSGTIPAEDQYHFLVISSLSGMIVLIPPSLLEVFSGTTLTLPSLVVTIVFGVLMDGVGYFVWTKALAEARTQRVPIEKVTSIIYLLPVLSVALTQLFFPSDRINYLQCGVGIAFLTASAFLCQRPEAALRLIHGIRTGLRSK